MASCSAFLGPDHPLVRVTEALDRVVRQALSVAALLAGSIMALSDGVAWAGPLVVSAALVLSGLMVVVVALELGKRDRALELIIDGRESLPLAAVERQRRRLLAPRTRAALARSFEGMIREASHPPKVPVRGIRPLFDRGVVARVAPELRRVNALLRADHAPARGVALAKLLLTDGASPLYGHQIEPLRDELHRVRHLLDG